MVLIAGLSKAQVLKAAHDASKPQGMGFMHFDPNGLSIEECEKALTQGDYFDYLQGRVMKISLAGDEVDPWGYDRDNGKGAFQRVVDSLRVAIK